MCDIWKNPAARELSPAELERHVADIAALSVRWVVLSGGEPLMHSDLFRLCAMLRSLGIKVTLLSSGLLLARYAEQINQHVDEVIVSLDGPPAVHDAIRAVTNAFRLLEDGVRQLACPVDARCTVQKRNAAHLAETAVTARALGLRSLSFLAADVTSEAFNRSGGWPIARARLVSLSAEDLAVLETQIDALIARPQDGFIRESPEKLRRIAHHFRAHLGLVPPVAPRCNAPWVSAVIESDGTVRPCFFHEPVGSLAGRTLLEVINGPEAVRFRETLRVEENKTCRRCVCSLYVPV